MSNLITQTEFTEVVSLIKSSRYKALQAINSELSNLNLQIGEKLSAGEFLDLPENHSEDDLQKSLIANFKKFILEIGRDFAYLGEGYRLQVGNEDFYLDLLFFHRGLQCLANFELKIKKFKPEFLGKLNFYLEALDRDVKKPHENPSIGVLLCKGKDDTVVEYALARNVSPALIADYETKLPDKKLLQAKIEEFAQMLETKEDEN
jgi:predicted nuclease of restriction endonuclease-like (RecB) superfamily